ncbi:hypothetical protein [Geodermatophilus poikilotrophus]|uniref:Uncharacterized protein n=1 Tax=Geodermatophilus poikilotrophus TaxID=1333667 RepID=A0A1I0IKS6_9ACTN|nr:hypothetical protein [Geodermatophilus poikilotrophus]SET96979.1 hypothetical protein SAMN04488546_4471 [Geodermatophilus poikilotrophus]
MSPLRWDVLAVSFLLALPLLALGLRGDLGTHDVVTRLPWCLAAGWAVVALLRWAGTPRPPAGSPADEDPGPAAP